MPSYKPLIKELPINKNLPLKMHIDMDGFFASCEQQSNPLLRGKPVGVVPYLNDRSTILASSYEAKAMGIKTGTRVVEAKRIYPKINLVLANPNKYRFINDKFMKVFKKFTPNVSAKSIDEARLDFKGSKFLKGNKTHQEKMQNIANKIKTDLKKQVGEYVTCSIGVGANSFIAKVASNINKPNGYYYVDHNNIHTFYDVLNLQDLHGVGPQIAARLNRSGIFTPLDFLNTDIYKLRGEFKLFGYHWYLRLRGYETDDIDFTKKNVGNSFHLTKFTNDINYIKIVMLKLAEKTGSRLRKHKLKARCFSVYLVFSDGTHFSKSHRQKVYFDSTNDLYKQFLFILNQNPYKNKQVRILGISTSMLIKTKIGNQYDLFGETKRKEDFYKAIDEINNTFGKFTMYPAVLTDHKELAPDRISFGR